MLFNRNRPAVICHINSDEVIGAMEVQGDFPACFPGGPESIGNQVNEQAPDQALVYHRVDWRSRRVHGQGS